LVVAQSSSEIPEGLMNNPVYWLLIYVTAEGKDIIRGTEVRRMGSFF
jgi:hypothetical protein